MSKLQVSVRKTANKTNSTQMAPPLKEGARATMDPIVQGIENLEPQLRQKVLSRAWADVAAVVDESHKLKACATSEYDWESLGRAVSSLPPTEKKEKAISAFYQAIISVLQEEKSRGA